MSERVQAYTALFVAYMEADTAQAKKLLDEMDPLWKQMSHAERAEVDDMAMRYMQTGKAPG